MNERIEIVANGEKITACLEVKPDTETKTILHLFATRGGIVESQFTVHEVTLLLHAWKTLLEQHQPRISPPAGQNTNTGKGELYI